MARRLRGGNGTLANLLCATGTSPRIRTVTTSKTGSNLLAFGEVSVEAAVGAVEEEEAAEEEEGLPLLCLEGLKLSWMLSTLR